jgi:hypothetical protein
VTDGVEWYFLKHSDQGFFETTAYKSDTREGLLRLCSSLWGITQQMLRDYPPPVTIDQPQNGGQLDG